MKPQTGILGGLAAAGLVYFLDRQQGSRRRAVIRDKALSLASRSRQTFRKAGRDLSSRASGAIAEARSRMRPQDSVDDNVLQARVRSRMGHVISHPSAIEVTARDGHVTLRGPILADEVDRLLDTVQSVPGVSSVQDDLQVHQQPGNVPELQGESRSRADGSSRWSPGIRVLAGFAGTALAAYGLSRRHSAGIVTSLAGAGLLAKALGRSNGGTRGLEFRKTLQINAPVDEVFRLFTDYENFPRFLRHVREVQKLGNGRSHWVVDGPMGTSVDWDADITEFERDRLLAWRSVAGSTVENAGTIRLEPAEGGTRVEMDISYRPPAGALGHAVASLFGRDLKTELDEDMVRFKSWIERGKSRSATGERVTRPGFEWSPQRT